MPVVRQDPWRVGETRRFHRPETAPSNYLEVTTPSGIGVQVPVDAAGWADVWLLEPGEWWLNWPGVGPAGRESFQVLPAETPEAAAELPAGPITSRIVS